MVAAFQPLLDLHRDLERVAREPDGRRFVSGWHAANPYAEEFLGPLAQPELDSTSYQSYRSDDELLGLVQRMHERFDGVAPSRRRIVPGDGSTGLIATFFFWLLRRRAGEVCYVPTVHDTFYYFFDLLGLDVRRASDRHPFEPGFELELPARRSVLFVADPTWYVGRPLDAAVVDRIAGWQRRTESIVFVDGTWQYLQWDASRLEHSSRLEPELTVRLIGPTKFLGLNGHRFSYLLVPEQLSDEIADMHENLHGSTSVTNLAFARRAIEVMLSATYNRALTDHVHGVYRSLTDGGHVETEIAPACGLYCFGRPTRELRRCVTMGGDYYELDGYPGYVRINLLGGDQLDPLRE